MEFLGLVRFANGSVHDDQKELQQMSLKAAGQTVKACKVAPKVHQEEQQIETNTEPETQKAVSHGILPLKEGMSKAQPSATQKQKAVPMKSQHGEPRVQQRAKAKMDISIESTVFDTKLEVSTKSSGSRVTFRPMRSKSLKNQRPVSPC